MLWIADAHCDYQSGLNVPKLKEEGFSALLVKATQGATGYTAPAKFDTWVSQARTAGLIPGAYHWLTSANAGSQLDHFLGRIKNPAGMLCAVDVEETTNPPSFATLSAFVNGWYARTNNHPLIIYSGNWWWDSRDWNGAQFTPYLWDSRYVSGTGYGSSLYSGVPADWWTPRYGGWSKTTMLQFTSKGSAGGIVGNVDISAYDGPVERLMTLTGQGEAISMAGETADFAASHVTAPDGSVCGSHTALSAIWGIDQGISAMVNEIKAKVDLMSTSTPTIDYAALAKSLIAEIKNS